MIPLRVMLQRSQGRKNPIEASLIWVGEIFELHANAINTSGALLEEYAQHAPNHPFQQGLGPSVCFTFTHPPVFMLKLCSKEQKVAQHWGSSC